MPTQLFYSSLVNSQLILYSDIWNIMEEMHDTAKALMKECYEMKALGDPAYASASLMQIMLKLKDTVGETYWKKGQEKQSAITNQRAKLAAERKKAAPLITNQQVAAAQQKK